MEVWEQNTEQKIRLFGDSENGNFVIIYLRKKAYLFISISLFIYNKFICLPSHGLFLIQELSMHLYYGLATRST